MSLVIDARTGQRISNGGAVISLCAQAWANAPQTKQGRVDAMDKFRADSDAKFIQGQVQRNDSLSSNAGSFPRDFEFVYNEVLTEERRPLNAERLFQADTRVPLGAKTHKVERELGTADAKIWRGGQPIPIAGTQRVEEQFEVIYIVAGAEVSWFDLISDNFEGRNTFENDTRTAIRAIREKMNDVDFHGAAPSKVYGFLNYPHLAKSVSPLVYAAGGATPADIVADLNRAANFANVASGGTFAPNRMATSIANRNFLMQTRMDSGTDTTIGEFFLRNNEFINSIESASELAGIGPNGEDGIAFYDDSLISTARVVVQPPTAMPAHKLDAFRDQVVYVAAIGGSVQRNVGNNHLMLVARS